jgi:hypothetical protein
MRAAGSRPIAARSCHLTDVADLTLERERSAAKDGPGNAKATAMKPAVTPKRLTKGMLSEEQEDASYSGPKGGSP